ncbi:MAG: MarR family transcriptional regulator [Sphingomicrobium sp.]
MEYASRLAVEPLLDVPSTLAPIIVAGSSAAARARGVAQVEAAGLRLAAAVPIEQAIERLNRQARASAVWIELDSDQGGLLDELLDRIDRDAGAGEYAAIVAAPAAMVDAVAARLVRGRVELLIDEGDGEGSAARVAALALALSLPHNAARLSDVASDSSAARLRQLTDEVGRIAATLARLSGGPGGGGMSAMLAVRPAPPGQSETGELTSADLAPEISQELLRGVIRARRLRSRYFSDELFADPAWDMLLDLTQAELAQVRVPVSSLCIAAAVPATTALRWIKTLTESGLLLRRADPHDGRRVFVEMAPATSNAMRRYFSEVSVHAGV